MMCPDCKKPMIKLDVFYDGTPCEPIWKCMRCKLEIEDEGEGDE